MKKIAELERTQVGGTVKIIGLERVTKAITTNRDTLCETTALASSR